MTAGRDDQGGLDCAKLPFSGPDRDRRLFAEESRQRGHLEPGALSGSKQVEGSGCRRPAPHRSRSAQRGGWFHLPLRGEFPGEDGRQLQGGGVLRWRPSDRIEVKPFYGRIEVMDDRDIPSIFTGGPYLPPKIERRNFGLDWTQSENERQFYGAVGSAQLSVNWQVRAGVFRWENHGKLNLTELYRNVQRDGSAQRTLVATKDQTQKSTSRRIALFLLSHRGSPAAHHSSGCSRPQYAAGLWRRGRA